MNIDTLRNEWDELTKEYNELEDCNRRYIELLEQLHSHQQKCFNEIKHQRYRMNQITASLKQCKTAQTPEEKTKVEELNKNTLKRKAQIHEIEQSLPTKSGLYLKIILGDVNVSILNRNDKVRYKDDYEKFKLILNVIGLLMAFLNLIFNYRALELAYIFLLVWYYCTLTIRESILKVNGSRIKGWWRAHHFISTAAAGVLLVWPQGEHWQLFRTQFMYFNVYINIVQYLQFGYQKGLLYRLKALGERHNMDITIEGFHSWMWRGLSFLLPFLFGGYTFQAYNAWTLYKLTTYPPGAPWHVSVMCGFFLLLFSGNIITTLLVVPEKIRERAKERYRLQSMGTSMKLRKMMRNSISETDISSQQLLANNKLENSTSFQNIGDAAEQATTTTGTAATIDTTTKTSSISTGNAITPTDGEVKQNQHKAQQQQQQPQQAPEQDVELTKPEDKKTN
ncbi:transmembrane protein 120 homolog isoform X1 [Bactrocera tryoni]|uniref:transmembrane protein 120 homolog isoform X1 n=1 Tax=Bactrocera tryoni TaxID=59916 RepID=UPI001A99F797|nr:transmembrane protein 120 homolog isoform X1 [Bactrocera tryoni]XP_039962468.1 transmembrane protein 120 homolog isoform X1 [Bactrocera tryoni]XP_039962470.1 transmembrane protein 120 homolog isoform X1 [Bactrocera tryoni]XP_039962471.1 transmembrane protein 120 homolog isoform X1 [Bactrocera tryoni]XP_039962472.1 transmembrane protein 120 homolog isoform X1 [Bactrocera tryoni]